VSLFSDQENVDIKEFIIKSVERTGGVVDEMGDDLLGAILPPEIAANVASNSFLILALSHSAAESVPDAVPAVIGTPIMDALIGFAYGIGTTSMSAIYLDNIRKKGLKEEAERVLTYSQCRLRANESAPVTVRESHYAIFHFRVAFVSYEKRERMETVAVSLDTNVVNNFVVKALRSLPIEPIHISPDEAGFDSKRLKVAYEVAQKELSQRAKKESTAYLSTISRRFQLEANRLSDYYDQTERELRRRLDKEADQKKRESILSKQQAVKQEKARKLAELGEKYRLRPKAALTSIQIIRQPKSYFDVYVDKGKQTRTVTLIYDSLLTRLEPPICDRCRLEMTRIFVTGLNEHLCVSCNADLGIRQDNSL
jgi:hypothetical protein